MIERATGSTYREYVTEHVFARAGMNRSWFFRMDVVEPDVAEGVEAVKDETVAASAGAETSTPTRPSVGPTAVPMSPSATSCASTGPWSTDGSSVPL